MTGYALEGYELGGCRLIRKIGSGAMGEVYLAEQVRLGNREVAVKVVPVQPEVSRQRDAAADLEQHIAREAQLLGRLTNPNILPVYHSGIEGGYRFLVMRYVPDGSLADAIKGWGPHRLTLPADPAFVVDIVGQVADALQHTHEHGIIHSDVKPGNVLVQVGPNGRWHALLADFGISHSADTLATNNEVAGTVAYMAPEQFSGQMSPASDQYALGVMAFQLLAGRTPFVGDLAQLLHAHQHERPPALRTLNSAVSSAVEAVIMRSLAKRPADRYRSVSAFAEALGAAAPEAGTAGASTRGVGLALPDEAGLSSSQARTLPAPPGLDAPALDAGPQAEPASSTAAPVRERPDSATRGKQKLMSTASAPTVPLTDRGAVSQPAAPRRREGGRRSIVVGLAAIVLLLVAGVAAIGLRSRIDLTHGSSHSSSTPPAVAGTGQTPAAGGAPAGTSTPPSSNGGSGGQGGGLYPPAPTAPPATAPAASPTLQPQPTGASTPEPTATGSPRPTATSTPLPSATATSPPAPSPQPTQPPVTASPQPTRPLPPTGVPKPAPTTNAASPPLTAAAPTPPTSIAAPPAESRSTPAAS